MIWIISINWTHGVPPRILGAAAAAKRHGVRRILNDALRRMVVIHREDSLMTTPPRDPIAAVTHLDPYPYYAELVARRPLYFDAALGLWVASSANTVAAILTSARCLVRPPTEPVPEALRGSPAGKIFGHIVRFNDGASHCPLKRAVSAALTEIAATR